MPGPVTAHYGWQMPLPGGDPTTWGTEINTVFGQIDGQVWVNQQAIAANGSNVGDVKMFAGATPPTSWAICDGSVQSTTGAMAALFAVIGYTYGGSGGNFNLPSAKDKVIVGAGGAYAIGATGGEATHLLAQTEMPTHAHSVNDPGHAHVSPAHVHAHYAHTHSVSGSQDAHNHSYNQASGAWPGGQYAGVSYYQQSGGVTSTAQPNVYVSIGAATTSEVAVAAAINAAVTSITTLNQGGGLAHNNMQPFLAMNLIIRYV